jgi:FlaA1/EpsC-like NDP-sugar epimerase
VEMDLGGDHRCAKHISIPGDICDGALLADICERFQPDIIYHAAALS